MFENWELCISVHQKKIRFIVCRFNKRSKRIEVSRAFEINITDEYQPSKGADSTNILVGIIKSTLKENKVNIKRYRLCISSRDIITRVIKLPKMDFKDLNSFLNLSISQYFPIKADEYRFDYKIQSINDKEDKEYYNLFLVAMPNTTMDYYSELFLKCGLRPKVIDIYYDVVSNLFVELMNKNIAIVDIGTEHTEFIMLEGKTIFINSSIDYSISKKEIASGQKISLSDISGTEEEERFLSVCRTLKNYIDFFSSRHHGSRMDELYFIGEGILDTDTQRYIEDSLNVQVKTGQELIKDKLVLSGQLKDNFVPQKYFSCFGLISGGMGK